MNSKVIKVRHATPQRHTLQHYFASCPTGLERVLHDELTGLGAEESRVTRGGVLFTGVRALCYRVNLESRVASRVLWQVFHGPYRNENDVYVATLSLPWHNWFASHRTIKVKVSARGCPLKSLDFVTLKIKDAICDKFRKITGRRPEVETRQPNIRIEAFLDATALTLYVDTSGEPLFKRGYRKGGGEAPLRENLAAGLVRLSGWTPDQVLLDPMCGGGTILIEAAHIARNIAPGLGRRFAFEQLTWFDPRILKKECEASRAKQALPRAKTTLRLYGSDLDHKILRHAEENLTMTGLTSVVRIEHVDVFHRTPPAPQGVLITNPPYGMRTGSTIDHVAFSARFGSVLKQQFAGWRAYILTAERDLPRMLRLSESQRIPLFNGALDCRLFEFKMVEGTMRRPKRTSGSPHH